MLKEVDLYYHFRLCQHVRAASLGFYIRQKSNRYLAIQLG